MQYWVYIIQSKSSGKYYKGYTADLERRLWEHCNGMSRYTKDRGPWELVFCRSFTQKKEALYFERRIKRFNSDTLMNLISSYAAASGH